MLNFLSLDFTSHLSLWRHRPQTLRPVPLLSCTNWVMLCLSEKHSRLSSPPPPPHPPSPVVSCAGGAPRYSHPVTAKLFTSLPASAHWRSAAPEQQFAFLLQLSVTHKPRKGPRLIRVLIHKAKGSPCLCCSILNPSEEPSQLWYRCWKTCLDLGVNLPIY